MTRGLTRKLALAAAALLATLIAVELGLRYSGYGEHVPVIEVDDNATQAFSTGFFVEDRELFWRVAECDPYCRNIRYAHPDNPRLSGSTGSRARVLCLGDSCTFFDGRTVPPYSVVLEHLLGGDRVVEVINAGVPGYTSYQGLAWLESELLEYAPDVVTVYFGWNDTWAAHALPDAEYGASIRLSPIRLLRLFGSGVTKGSKTRGARRVSSAEYAANLARIQRVATSAGAKCVFITSPGVFIAEQRQRLLATGFLLPGDDYMELRSQYNDVVRGLSLPSATVLDLATIFAAEERPTELFRRDGLHLSATGIQLAAEALQDHLVENELLP